MRLRMFHLFVGRMVFLSGFVFIVTAGMSWAQNWSYETSGKGVISYAFCGEGGEIPTTAHLVDGKLVYPKASLNWTDTQKSAVISALHTIENTFANVPGRTLRVAFALTNLNAGTMASTSLADRVRDGKTTWEQGDLGGDVAEGKAYIADFEQVWKYGSTETNSLLLADVVIQFNANTIRDNPNYLYYGDPKGIGRDQMDFETVVLHEMGHALGFYNGLQVNGGVSAFDALTASVAVPGQLVNQLVFQGNQTVQYVRESGNSLFDYDHLAYYGEPPGVYLQARDGEPTKADHLNHHMEYNDAVMPTSGMGGKIRREYSDMELAMFKDMGWTLANDPFASVPEPGSVSLLMLSVALFASRRRR